MRKRSRFYIWSLCGLLLLGGLLFSTLQLHPVVASTWQSHDSTVLNAETVLNDLAQANVIYLGETHDSAADHAAQLQIIRSLHARNPQIAIGMEMFQRPYQAVVDQYLAGEITATELRQQSQYDQRWGFPWKFYAPILEFAQTHRLPVLALNVPAEVTRQVAQGGLESLSQTDRRWIPPSTEIHTDNPAYRQRLQTIYDQIHQGRSASMSFENFVLAQVVWDETMAAAVAEFLQANPETQVIVLAGQGHIVYGDGIPDRVARRLAAQSSFSQRSVLLNPTPEQRSDPEIADYFWTSP
jgi:uncharacterized iron-regulated protein